MMKQNFMVSGFAVCFIIISSLQNSVDTASNTNFGLQPVSVIVFLLFTTSFTEKKNI
jgi:hypothetical protein